MRAEDQDQVEADEDVAPRLTRVTPFDPDGLFEASFQTAHGAIDILAEIEVSGTTLHIKDIAIYPRGAGALHLGIGQVRGLLRQVANLARSDGFATLRITGIRYSGARPGRRSEIVIDLTGEA